MADASEAKASKVWRGIDSAYSVFDKPIVQSAQDDRHYKLIKLANELQALLISDPTTDKAAASLNVGVGHLSDPDDRPGLAHFCEHLLFLGTEQFPKENAYSEFVSQHGGGTNAYTSTTNTNYHFNISASALPGALERFSTFFHSPLFSPSGTAREIKAVDSENKKNKQSDLWRLFQLDKSLSATGNRWSKFGSGNYDSLMGQQTPKENGHVNGAAVNGVSTKTEESEPDDGGEAGREVRRILLDWYSKHYSANRMTLVILGKESIEDLITITTRLFSPIPNRNLAPLLNDALDRSSYPKLQSPWGPEQEGTTIFAKTVMDFRALELRWAIPWSGPLYKIKPSRVISHFLGHEGVGSICSVLKKQGWITALSSSSSGGDRDNGWDFFRISMSLTKEGWVNYASIVRTVNAYISLLHSSAIPRWHFNEMKTIAETAFRFSEKSSPDTYVTHLAEALSKPYAREDVLSGGTLLYEFDETSVRDVLSMMSPTKARLMMMARDDTDWAAIQIAGKPLFSEGKNAGKWQKEKWYDTEYLTRPMDLGDGIAVGGLELPDPNTFIPTDFEVDRKEVAEPLKRPLKIRETPLSTLWYKKDDRFWVPKATFVVRVKSPLASITPRNRVLTRLFGDLVEDALTEQTYDADIAGLSYRFQGQSDGLYISVGGYNDKLPVLLRTILTEAKNFVVDPRRFEVLKEQLRQEWENSELDQPYTLTEFKVAHIIRERSWTARERLNELEFVTAEDIQKHIFNLISRTHSEALIHGNVSKDSAISVMREVEEILNPRNLTPSERISMRSHILPSGKNYVFETPVPNKDDVNSSLMYYCQIGDNTDVRLRSTVHLLAQIAREPCFDQLRTKEQLGYIVFSGTWSLTGVLSFKITVQSERTPIYLESRVDAFLEQLRVLITDMSAEAFDRERQSLIDKKMDKLKNLSQETNRFWGHIHDGYNDFLKHEIECETLRTITKDEVLSLFMSHIHPSSPTRSKLSAHFCSQVAPSPRMSLAASAELLKHLKAAGIPVQEVPFNAAAAMQFSVTVNQNYWTAFFEKDMPEFDKGVAAHLIALMPKLAKMYPHEEPGSAGPVKLPGDTIFIDNIAEFKSTLPLSKAAFPVEVYTDFGSKL